VRYQGKITDWRDDKGFGYVTPNGGGPKVFVRSLSGSDQRKTLIRESNGEEICRLERLEAPFRRQNCRSKNSVREDAVSLDTHFQSEIEIERATAMHVLELKIPPVAVVLAAAALMWLVAWAVSAFKFLLPARDLVAMSFALAGAVTSALGVVSFRRARTTVNPMKPELSSSLVTSGIYKLSRNPMYLGFLLVLLGWAVFLSSVLAFLFLPAFILYMNRFQIDPEERALAALFGQEFTAYKARARRWL